MRHLLLSPLLLPILSACISSQQIDHDKISQWHCAPKAELQTKADLKTWYDRKLAFAENQSPNYDALAVALTDCLSHPDPFYRDKIGYEALTHFLRSKKISDQGKRDLRRILQSKLTEKDDTGVAAPFAALILSELARADRVEAYLSPQDRVDLSNAAATYIQNITDYRAFDQDEGWRHGVAHGADIAMQLSLNKDVQKSELIILRDAIEKQISPDVHAYIHGEATRLARPILFMMQRDTFTAQEWVDWLEPLGDPAPLENWGEAFQDEAALIRLHNRRAFAQEIYIKTSLSDEEKFITINKASLEIIKKLP